ncbi:uncharacterized protein LOC110852653 isoform X2 [Folsomia candida]|nr:uncharacterized protein LOC110852653 isoform X2 [Folsomia candida]
MGTDRVRLTDTKYMATLLERLEEQERQAWTTRRIGRIKAERNRYRKLAIDGLMEPGRDMQDLYKHPVFRVNRVLNRLAKMDHNITLTPTDTLPPIVEVDPFMTDNSGGAFKYYPGHSVYEGVSEVGDLESSQSQMKMGRSSTQQLGIKKSIIESSSNVSIISSKAKGVTPKASSVRIQSPLKESESRPRERLSRRGTKHTRVKSTSTQGRPSTSKDLGDTENQDGTPARVRSYSIKLSEQISMMDFPELPEMEKRYGIPSDTDLLEWGPFRDQLVDTVFHEDGQRVWDLYQMAEDVLGVYSREIETSDDFSLKLNRLMRG